MKYDKVFTGIKARLKDYGIVLTAISDDDVEIPVYVNGTDLKKLFRLNPAAFLEKYDDDTEMLFELFYAANNNFIDVSTIQNRTNKIEPTRTFITRLKKILNK